jgi:hypothetical protein
VTTAVPVIPGSLGIYDLVTIHILQIFDMDPTKSVAGTLLFRSFLFLWCVPLGAIGLLYLKAIIRGRRCMTSKEGPILSQEVGARLWPRKILSLFGSLKL